MSDYKARIDALEHVIPTGKPTMRPGTVFIGTLPECDGWVSSAFEDASGAAVLYTSPGQRPLILRNGKLEPFEMADEPLFLDDAVVLVDRDVGPHIALRFRAMLGG